MSDETPDDVTMTLAALDDDNEALLDHPEEISEEEAAEGHDLYLAVDDTDDDDSGLGPKVGAAPSSAMRKALIVKECLLRHGVPEVSIELQAGRPVSGDRWDAIRPVSVFSHHIASTPTSSKPTPGLSLVKRGRKDLGGPLANGTAGVDLVYRILTLGYGNHPGTGGPLTVKGPMGTYTIPRNNARRYAWGTEFEGGYSNAVWDKTYTNRRTGASMTFREFMGRVNAGLTEAIWLINGGGRKPQQGADLSGYHGEHKTWAPGRKPDRKDYSTASGRAEIRKYNTVAKPTLDEDLDAVQARFKVSRFLMIRVLAQQGVNALGPSARETGFRQIVELVSPEDREKMPVGLLYTLDKVREEHETSRVALIRSLAESGRKANAEHPKRAAVFERVEKALR